MQVIRKYGIPLLSALGIIVLIFDSKTAIAGALDGIHLCMYSLIPAIFPFLILSSILVKYLQGRPFRFLEKLGTFCGIPKGAESLFIVGLIGGYPIGAKLIGDAYKSKSISKQDAMHMLGFCSNSGPSFIFGVIGPQFISPYAPWFIWFIHILAAIFTGHLLNNHTSSTYKNTDNVTITISEIIKNSTQVMAIISAWVILFRVIIYIIKKWAIFVFPLELQVLVFGILELTNGCISLNSIANSAWRLLICSIMLSFGGLCVLMQTYGVVSLPGTGKYFPGKLLQTAIATVLTSGFLYNAPVTILAIIAAITIHKIFIRKSSRFSMKSTI